MTNILWKTIINTLALYLVSFLIPSVTINSPFYAILAGLSLSLLAITIRPIMMALCLPLNLLSFGAFIFIINTWILQLTDLMVKGLHIPGFWIALAASIIIMLCNYMAARIQERWISYKTSSPIISTE